jgi:hypothetical protein
MTGAKLLIMGSFRRWIKTTPMSEALTSRENPVWNCGQKGEVVRKILTHPALTPLVPGTPRSATSAKLERARPLELSGYR